MKETDAASPYPATVVKIGANGSGIVSGLLSRPACATACCVLAHGAGAGMCHPFMGQIAAGLADRHIATLRFQFPYMERGAKMPDRPAVAIDTIKAAVAAAGQFVPDLPLVAGGKSFGGRMTSQAQAEAPLRNVKGLFFLGFPLHPANVLSIKRAAHLSRVFVPMLFVQGTRDTMANLPTLRPIIQELGGLATLKTIEGGDHSFHVPKASGQSDAEAIAEVLDDVTKWIGGVVKHFTT